MNYTFIALVENKPGVLNRVASLFRRRNFDLGPYFNDKQADGFYEEIVITFIVRDAAQHYHVPLLLSPFGYSTYRGS